jgi:hypothetical protein
MKKTHKPAKPVSADAIARLADRGKDVSGFFRGQGRMAQPTTVQPIQSVNVDLIGRPEDPAPPSATM